jgi:hypothetical protein
MFNSQETKHELLTAIYQTAKVYGSHQWHDDFYDGKEEIQGIMMYQAYMAISQKNLDQDMQAVIPSYEHYRGCSIGSIIEALTNVSGIL